MVVRIHGQTGTPMDTVAQQCGPSARRGAFSESRVGADVQAWLGNLSEVYHLFHNLVRLDHVTGASWATLTGSLLPMLRQPTPECWSV